MNQTYGDPGASPYHGDVIPLPEVEKGFFFIFYTQNYNHKAFFFLSNDDYFLENFAKYVLWESIHKRLFINHSKTAWYLYTAK